MTTKTTITHNRSESVNLRRQDALKWLDVDGSQIIPRQTLRSTSTGTGTVTFVYIQFSPFTQTHKYSHVE